MIWTKDKIYLLFLITILLLSIISTLYFNNKKFTESFDISNKRIFVLYTSGTIGMLKTKNGYKPHKGFLESKLRDITKDSNKISPYDIVEYSPLLDSSNITPRDWGKIAHDIASVYNDYDAFIVIHGTDTMEYTASALSFMLENLKKPVIVTSSSTSINNIVTSLILASKYNIPEVIVCVADMIMRGCRSTKYRLSSPNFPLLGKTGSKIKINNKIILKHTTDPFNLLNIDPDKKVVVVKLFPGIDAQYLDGIMQDKDIHGIVLETFGTQTNQTFINKLKMLINRGIFIVNISQYSSVSLENIGVVSGKDMTTEATMAKLYIILSNVPKLNLKLFKKLIIFEMRGEITN
jgi:L-asparaginase